VKDHASLLRAAARLRAAHPKLRVLLVGDGPSRGELETLAASLGITYIVTFAGERLGGGNYHHAFDVSVLCSLSEGFPNAIVEAMAAARPVAATAVGGSVDAVEDGVTGLLVPPSSPDALAGALDRLLGSAELRRDFGVAGRDRARARYAASNVLASLETLYDDLLARRSA
jgi:glycosyltransferase involved in cell wall biosynthesis